MSFSDTPRLGWCSLLLLLGCFQIGLVHAQNSSSSSATIFSLGNQRPEGIHALPLEANTVMGLPEGDQHVLVSDLLWGSIQAVNLETGDQTEIVESLGPGVRAALGMWYDSGAILVGGAGAVFGLNETFQPVVYVYNAATGELITQCGAEFAIFTNDVTVVNGKAYATDSLVNTILEMDVAAAINEGECVTREISTPAEIFAQPEGFKANGIIAYADGLLIANSVSGGLFYLDLIMEETNQILPDGSIVCGDGLAIGATEDGSGDILYVSENCNNRHSGWLLQSSPTVSAELQGYLLSDDYDDPATCDVVGETLWAVNARFNSAPFTPIEFDLELYEEEFSVIGLNRFGFQGIVEEEETGDIPVDDADDEEEVDEEEVDQEEVDEEIPGDLPPIDEDSEDEILLGESYCTYSPDYDCYSDGWPMCCTDDTMECPDEQPSCD